MGFRFPKECRLKKRQDFKETEMCRIKCHGKFVLVFANLNNLDIPRIGITVTKKVGNSVTRNWWKRRIREIFRLNLHSFSNLDFVVIVKRSSVAEFPPFRELEMDVLTTIKQAAIKIEKNVQL